MWNAGSASFTCPKWPLHICRVSPQVWQKPSLLEMPMRPSKGPLGCTARSRAKSKRFRSQTSSTPWFTMSWLDLCGYQPTRTVYSISETHSIPNCNAFMRLGTVSTTCSFMVGATDAIPVAVTGPQGLVKSCGGRAIAWALLRVSWAELSWCLC